MPVKVKKIGEKFRVVESASGQISKTDKGNPVDGGGHKSKADAIDQAQAINISIHKKKGE